VATTEGQASLTEVLARIRHDLRTPVGHIIGYAEMIEEEAGSALSPDAGRDLKSIQAIGQRLIALIDAHVGENKRSVDELDLARAHFEFRAQLNDVAGYAAMLREDAVEAGNDDLVSDLDHIVDAEAALLELIETHLTVDAIERVALPVAATPTDGGVEGEQEPAIAEDLVGASDREAGPSEGGHILVVDDDAANADLLVRRLSGQGYRTDVAASGDAALAWLEDHRPDLILLDLVMPGMGGYEVLTRVKSDSRLQSIPVLMLSAADRSNDVVRCIALGAEDFIPKPFNPILLRARISAVLEKHRLRAQFAAQLKVFVSSPGDVIPERRVVKQVITDLNEEYAGRAILIPMLWEEEPLLASESFQAQIKPSADADIYIGIFWSRIGSMLPDTLRRPDGSRYESGTAYELEEALTGHQASGRPDILVYRKQGAPTMSLESPDAVLEQLDQMKRLAGYLEARFVDADGSYSGAFHTFTALDEFESMVVTHMRKLVSARLEAIDGPTDPPPPAT
jgi:CheY-like chemotaxis protein